MDAAVVEDVTVRGDEMDLSSEPLLELALCWAVLVAKSHTSPRLAQCRQVGSSSPH